MVFSWIDLLLAGQLNVWGLWARKTLRLFDLNQP
jgi:hypothetical protein